MPISTRSSSRDQEPSSNATGGSQVDSGQDVPNMTPSSGYSFGNPNTNVVTIDILKTAIDQLTSSFVTQLQDVLSEVRRPSRASNRHRDDDSEDDRLSQNSFHSTTRGHVDQTLVSNEEDTHPPRRSSSEQLLPGSVASANPVPINQINPPNFSGDRSKAREWLTDYDTTMEINGFPGSQKVKRAHAYMSKGAKDWHIVTMDLEPKIDWATYKKRFLDHFCGVQDLIRIREKLDNVRQGSDEHPSDFAHKILHLCKQLSPTMAEAEKVSRIARGLDLNIANVYNAIRPIEEWSLKDFLRALAKHRMKQVNEDRKKNDNSSRVLASTPKGSASTRNSTPRNLEQWVCFNCDDKGHVIENCKKPVDEARIKAKRLEYRNAKISKDSSPKERAVNHIAKVSSCPSRPNLPCDNIQKLELTLNINGLDMIGRLDSGADMSIIPDDAVRPCKLNLLPWDQPPLLAASNPVIPLGMAPVLVNLNGIRKTMLVAIVPSGIFKQPLWGLDFLDSFKILKFDQTVKPLSADAGSLNSVSVDRHPIDKINLDGLDTQTCRLFEETLSQFGDVFSRDEQDIGRTSTVKHRIHLVDDKPVARPPYRPPLRMRSELEKTLEKMKESGAIRESKSPYASPVFFVDKDHGQGKRLVADYRALNAKTIPDRTPMPHPEDVFGLLAGANFFTKLDITSMFFQIEVDERDIEKTAITTPMGLFEYPLMPFGLINAPATAVRLMKEVLRGLDGKTCYVYFDDIIIFAPSTSALVQRCTEVLERLRNHNLKLKPGKCLFGVESVCFLGHIISARGIEMDPRRVERVKTFPVPRNPSDVRSFHGLCSYNRKFIKNFAQIAKPLTPLMGKPSDFAWTSQAQTAFEQLRDALMATPVLVHFNPEAQHELRTDASAYAIGAVLFQKHSDPSQTGVVLYYSKTLTPAQRNYSATHRELLAAFKAIMDHQHYLVGKKFTLVTDHAALSLLRTQRKDPHQQIARMVAQLQAFDFDVVYKPGSTHLDADCMSRLIEDTHPHSYNRGDSIGVREVRAINHITTGSEDLPTAQEEESDMGADQRNDDFCNKFIEILENPTLSDREKAHLARNFTIQDGLLYRKNLQGNLMVVIPARRRAAVLLSCHDIPLAAHLGFSRTYNLAKRRCYWPKMRQEIKRYVASCIPCQKRKISNKRKQGFIQPMPVAEDAFDIVGIDLITKLPVSHDGFNTILVCTDNLSKYAIAVPLKNELAETIIHAFFNHVVAKHGCPKVVISDRGANISGERSRDFFRLFAIKRRLTSAYHPQSNGQTERFNRTLKASLTMYVDANQRDWSSFVQAITFAYNITVHSVTKVAPFEAVFGRAPRIPLDNLIERSEFIDPTRPAPGRLSSEDVIKMKQLMRASQEKNKRRLDANLARPTFKEGDLVLVERPTHVRGISTKLTFTYLGPYRITKKLSDVSYAVANVRGRSGTSVIHAWHLRAFVPRDSVVTSEDVDPTYIPREAIIQDRPSSDTEDPVLVDVAPPVDITDNSGEDEPSPPFSPISTISTLSARSFEDALIELDVAGN